MESKGERSTYDVAVIGAGAAGLATAIFAARLNTGLSVAALDGAKKIGAKILISGGGRCNVTNVKVMPEDFWGGSSNVVRRVLGAFPVARTLDFFDEIGVALHEEEHGKLFPDTNRARTVLDALLAEAVRRRVVIRTANRVHDIVPAGDCFEVHSDGKVVHARRVVLATGGRSLPKTGSDGFGYELAKRLGHSLLPTTPGLAPLLLDGDFHAGLSGISQDVEVTVRVSRDKPIRLRGAMLWTHFGASGPVILNASRFWHQAELRKQPVRFTVNFLPEENFESAESQIVALAAARPRMHLRNTLATQLPARVAVAILRCIGLKTDLPLAQLPRADRRLLVRSLLEWPLPVIGSRGYAYAEVTAGGIPFNEINSSTMESRLCPNLFLVGEILDVDGRIGGFNFQWAWASAHVAASYLART